MMIMRNLIWRLTAQAEAQMLQIRALIIAHPHIGAYMATGGMYVLSQTSGEPVVNTFSENPHFSALEFLSSLERSSSRRFH
jgi:hypothetical protein